MTGRSISDQTFHPAAVESGRIVNVNIKDWTVDVVSQHGDKKWFDIQVASPYLHFANGEGIYAMPEVGAMVWVCKPSEGSFAPVFVMGYQGVYDESEKNFRNGRSSLNPGDIMMRGRDENFIILRRGGVLQIGATPMAQRIYIPIRNIIRDFCENYDLNTIAGELTFDVGRTEELSADDLQTTALTGDAPTSFKLTVREKAKDKLPIAYLTIGSHKDNSKTTLVLDVKASGDEGAQSKATLTITKEGDVTWDIKQDFTLQIQRNYRAVAQGTHTTESKGNMSLISTQGTFDARSTTSTVTVHAGTELNLEAGANANLKAGAMVNVEGTKINLGGAASVEPALLGSRWLTFMTTLLQTLGQYTCPACQILTGAPVPVIPAPAVAAMTGSLAAILSTRTFLDR